MKASCTIELICDGRVEAYLLCHQDSKDSASIDSDDIVADEVVAVVFAATTGCSVECFNIWSVFKERNDILWVSSG